MRHIVEYCAKEVERQHCGAMQVLDMYRAWEYACDKSMYHAYPTENEVMRIAYWVENHRQVNVVRTNNYRVTNVTISGLVAGNHPNTIPLAMNRWSNSVQDIALGNEAEVDWAIKALLDIHPWADGNGRTASIVRNWLNGTLQKPTMLPNYYCGQE
jgi:hypothetical protein